MYMEHQPKWLIRVYSLCLLHVNLLQTTMHPNNSASVQAIQFKVSHQSFDIYLIIWLCACNGIYLFTFADKVLKLKAIEGSYLKHR